MRFILLFPRSYSLPLLIQMNLLLSSSHPHSFSCSHRWSCTFIFSLNLPPHRLLSISFSSSPSLQVISSVEVKTCEPCETNSFTSNPVADMQIGTHSHTRTHARTLHNLAVRKNNCLPSSTCSSTCIFDIDPFSKAECVIFTIQSSPLVPACVHMHRRHAV